MDLGMFCLLGWHLAVLRDHLGNYEFELVSAVCKANALHWCTISPFPHVAAEHFTRGSVAKELLTNLRLY